MLPLGSRFKLRAWRPVTSLTCEIPSSHKVLANGLLVNTEYITVWHNNHHLFLGIELLPFGVKSATIQNVIHNSARS
jgi:hypothetical protein